MRRFWIALAVFLGLALAQMLEVGGEVSRFGIAPYVIIQWPIPLSGNTFLIPSVFVYPNSLEASLSRGWISLQLLQEGRDFSAGLELYWNPYLGPALRLFLRGF